MIDRLRGDMQTMRAEVDVAAHPGNRIGVRPPRTRAWRDGRVVAEGFPVAEVSDRLAAGAVVWLDLCGPAHDDLHVIADELDLDEVAVEDAVSQHERSKLDRYPAYAFLNAYATSMEDQQLRRHGISAFVTANALVTVREDPSFDVDELMARWDGNAGLVTEGVAALLYGLLDLIVDSQLATVQELDDEADSMEDLIFDDAFPVREIQRRTFQLRKNLVRTRRVVLPMSEILSVLLRRDLHVVPPALAPYFQDVHDHALRAEEWTESLRELLANLLDTRIALQSNRLNEVMKKVTSWAAIIAVPTAVTGFYGQNVPYPGSQQHWGFLTSTAIMIACSLGLYLVFKRRDWL
jgi:magnesium transporter